MTPGIRDLSTLQHEVVDRPLTETAARRKPGVAGPDDDGGYAFDDSPPAAARRYCLLTWTFTFVGFVTTSYTAERFWDCATSASISCFEASASMLNVTLMSS